MRENRAAFERWVLRPRMLVDVSDVTTATTVLGDRASMPLLVAPTAFQRMAHPEGELAMARGAAAAGTVMCLSTLATATIEEVAQASGDAARWFQLYWSQDRGVVTRPSRSRGRVRLHRARADGRPSGARPSRARPPHRLRDPGGDPGVDLPRARRERRRGVADGHQLGGRQVADVARPRVAALGLVAAAAREGDPDGRGRALGGRAGRRRRRRVEPRRPAAGRRRGRARCAARGGRGRRRRVRSCSWTAASAAARTS